MLAYSTQACGEFCTFPTQCFAEGTWPGLAVESTHSLNQECQLAWVFNNTGLASASNCNPIRWLTTEKWAVLNTTIGEQLEKFVPRAASCYNNSEDISTTNGDQCSKVTAEWFKQEYVVNSCIHPGYRQSSSFSISVISTPTDSSEVVKKGAWNILTNVVNGSSIKAASNRQ